MSILDKIFGNYSKKELARIKPIMQKVLDLDAGEEEWNRFVEELKNRKKG